MSSMSHPWSWYPRKGDMVEPTITNEPGRGKLPWYLFPPSYAFDTPPGDTGSSDHSMADRLSPISRGFSRGAIFGPVAEVDDTWDRFGRISVKVPLPWNASSVHVKKELVTKPEFIWINMYKKTRSGGYLEMAKVRRDTPQAW